MEWEILGDLGLRLHHKEEAKEAYQRCLDSTRYSAKPWMRLLDVYAEEGDIQRTLQVAIRVAAYQYGEYTEMTVRFLKSVRFWILTRIVLVPDSDCSMFVQTRPDTRARKNQIHFVEYGAT